MLHVKSCVVRWDERNSYHQQKMDLSTSVNSCQSYLTFHTHNRFSQWEVILSCSLGSKLIVIFCALVLYICTSQKFLFHFCRIHTEALSPSNIFIPLVFIFMPLLLRNLIFQNGCEIRHTSVMLS